MLTVELLTEADTLRFAKRLAAVSPSGCVFYLQGELGAGKTTFCRGFIRALGHQGTVKSPSYTLIEPYQLAKLQVFHVDLYRLVAPEELHFLGLQELLQADSICLIEWPERGEDVLPPADVVLRFVVLDQGRQLTVQACSSLGEAILAQLNL